MESSVSSDVLTSRTVNRPVCSSTMRTSCVVTGSSSTTRMRLRGASGCGVGGFMGGGCAGGMGGGVEHDRGRDAALGTVPYHQATPMQFDDFFCYGKPE